MELWAVLLKEAGPVAPPCSHPPPPGVSADMLFTEMSPARPSDGGSCRAFAPPMPAKGIMGLDAGAGAGGAGGGEPMGGEPTGGPGMPTGNPSFGVGPGVGKDCASSPFLEFRELIF